MRISTRYGLSGLAALSLLSGVHWLRDRGIWPGTVGQWFAGVTPNFAAAIAITFVLLSIWADQKGGVEYSLLRRRFLVCASISGAGLLAWELIQMTNRRFVFDTFDILATLCGIAISVLLFQVITPKGTDNDLNP